MRSYRYCGIRYSCAEFYSDTDMQSHPCLRHGGEFFQTRGPSGESPPPTITYPSIHHAIVGGRDFTGVGFLTEGSTLSVPLSLSLYLCLMFRSLFPSVCLAGRLSVSLALTLCLSLCLRLCHCLYLSLSLPLPLSPSLSLSLPLSPSPSLSLSLSLSPFLSSSLRKEFYVPLQPSTSDGTEAFEPD